MGLGVAKLLASKGANVVIVARDVSKLETAIETISVREDHAGFGRTILIVIRPLPKAKTRKSSTTSAQT